MLKLEHTNSSRSLKLEKRSRCDERDPGIGDIINNHVTHMNRGRDNKMMNRLHDVFNSVFWHVLGGFYRKASLDMISGWTEEINQRFESAPMHN